MRVGTVGPGSLVITISRLKTNLLSDVIVIREVVWALLKWVSNWSRNPI